MKDITRLYDRLSNGERAKLFIEAAARMDIEELDKLNDTCPRKNYSAEDMEYSSLKRRYIDITHFYRIGSDRFLISALVALIGVLSSEGEEAPKLEKIFRESLAGYQGHELAWERFCDDIGIDHLTLKKASMVGDALAAEFLIGLANDPIKPDLDAEKRCYEMLTGIMD